MIDKNVADITPAHKVIRLFREIDQDMLANAKAAFICVLSDEDKLWYETCGETKKDVLWTLKLAERNLMDERYAQAPDQNEAD